MPDPKTATSGSSNGRTADFESANRGSTPRPETTEPRTKSKPTVAEMIEWVEWKRHNTMLSKTDYHWLGKIEDFLKEYRDGIAP